MYKNNEKAKQPQLLDRHTIVNTGKKWAIELKCLWEIKEKKTAFLVLNINLKLLQGVFNTFLTNDIFQGKARQGKFICIAHFSNKAIQGASHRTLKYNDKGKRNTFKTL